MGKTDTISHMDDTVSKIEDIKYNIHSIMEIDYQILQYYCLCLTTLHKVHLKQKYKNPKIIHKYCQSYMTNVYLTIKKKPVNIL
jgi:hypothetical protein